MMRGSRSFIIVSKIPPVYRTASCSTVSCTAKDVWQVDGSAAALALCHPAEPLSCAAELHLGEHRLRDLLFVCQPSQVRLFNHEPARVGQYGAANRSLLAASCRCQDEFGRILERPTRAASLAAPACAGIGHVRSGRPRNERTSAQHGDIIIINRDKTKIKYISAVTRPDLRTTRGSASGVAFFT